MNTLTIRLIEPRDAPQAARLWCDGLQQTIDAAPPEKRETYEKFFREAAEKECAEGGGIGVDGQGLIDFYYHDPNGSEDKDCRMFVAVRDLEVLGIVGVKRGMDDKELSPPKDPDSEDYSLFSIWKMSVATTGRRLGIGKRLMNAVEKWVRERPGARAIRLYTANPIAASFYTSPQVGFNVFKMADHYGIYEKKM